MRKLFAVLIFVSFSVLGFSQEDLKFSAYSAYSNNEIKEVDIRIDIDFQFSQIRFYSVPLKFYSILKIEEIDGKYYFDCSDENNIKCTITVGLSTTTEAGYFISMINPNETFAYYCTLENTD